MDRNCWRYRNRQPNIPVALRKESVDRNDRWPQHLCCGLVALRKESVDRNVCDRLGKNDIAVSLSARRAWIEITVSVISHCI